MDPLDPLRQFSIADCQYKINRAVVINGILQSTLKMFSSNRSYIFIYDFANQRQVYEYDVCTDDSIAQHHITY